MRRAGILLLLLAVLLQAAAHHAAAEQRVALVIGNATYEHAPRLRNPRNDAEDVAAALKRIGFEVILGIDLDEDQMQDATIRFSRTARSADVALFYYAGHAMQFEGVNYLMPVDASLADKEDLRRLIRADEIIHDLQQARSLRILVLDACRDNPLAEDLSRSLGSGTRGAVNLMPGLAHIASQEGMIISFSTQAAKTADDGAGRNSPYSAAFLKHIETPEEIVTVFRDVTYDVYAATAGKQLPELSMSLTGEFYLIGLSRPLTADDTAKASDPAAMAWQAIQYTTDTDLLSKYLAEYPDSIFAALARARLTQLASATPEVQVRSPGKSEYPFQAILTQPSELHSSASSISGSVRRLSVGEVLTVEGQAEEASWYRVSDRAGAHGFVRKSGLSRLQ